MNWAGNQKGEGFEFHILAIGIALVVIRAAQEPSQSTEP